MRAVQEAPSGDTPMGFTVLRVPFFLEPDYPEGAEFEETNRVRLLRKWGGKAGWEAQKERHNLKGRGREVGIEHFNLDRVASNTMASHRLVQWVTKTLGVNAAENMYNDLNQKHFEGGVKLNDREMLLEAAVAVGAEQRVVVLPRVEDPLLDARAGECPGDDCSLHELRSRAHHGEDSLVAVHVGMLEPPVGTGSENEPRSLPLGSQSSRRPESMRAK